MLNKTDKSDADQVKDAQGNVLAPGTVVPQPGTEVDPKLAEKGIYQPSDLRSNVPQPGLGTKPEDQEAHDEHVKNLQNLPPVPSQSAGAASQAK